MNGGIDSLELRTYPPFLPEDRSQIAEFLATRSLSWDEEPDFSAALLDRGRMVAVGSLSGRVIKGLAVEEALSGEGLALRIMTELEAEAGRRGIARTFVFTGPANRAIFESTGYRLIGEAPGEAVLLEKGDGIKRWREELAALARSPREPRGGSGSLDAAGASGEAGAPGAREGKPSAALVMNCNPFTLGHLHLVRRASAESGRVFLFVVSEEASAFPFEVRFRLVREGVASLPNVTVIPGSDYVVSRATFPTYFLKDKAGQAARIHARLDADLFGRWIAPAVGAARRFIGEEPYSEVTAIYNSVMKDCLPSYGVEVVEIPRLADARGAAVSASTVRRLIREGRLAEARELVPASTWEYLASPEAGPALARVAAAAGRH